MESAHIEPTYLVGMLVVVLVTLAVVLVVQFRTRRKPVEKVCWTCTHFNHADGQSLIRQHPVFAEACKHVPPQRMSQRYSDDGEVIVDPGAPQVPYACEWRDFGLCARYAALIWKRDPVGLDDNPDTACEGWVRNA